MSLRKKRIIRKAGIKKGVYILPNLCTTGSLLCGFFAIIQVLNGEFVEAAWAILLAGIFDMFDGQIARLTRGASQFGIEYDSLVDLVSFGVAPSILMYIWVLHDFGRLGWICAFLFCACGCLRLARFNVQADGEERQYFQGLPVPMAAYVLATTVIFYDAQYIVPPQKNGWMLGGIVFLGLLMVSTVRYRNAKQWDMKTRISFFVLVASMAVIAFVAWNPAVMMWVMALLYTITGPLEELYSLVRHGRRAFNEPLPKKEGQGVSLVHSSTIPLSRDSENKKKEG